MWSEICWGMVFSGDSREHSSLYCAFIHFLCQLRQHSQCLAVAALAPHCFFWCFLFSFRVIFFILCRVCAMNTNMGGKGSICVSGISVARIYWSSTIHSLLLLLGYVEAASSKAQWVMLWLLRGIKRINMELHIFFYYWHSSSHKGELRLLCSLQALLQAHMRAQWAWCVLHTLKGSPHHKTLYFTHKIPKIQSLTQHWRNPDQ